MLKRYGLFPAKKQENATMKQKVIAKTRGNFGAILIFWAAAVAGAHCAMGEAAKAMALSGMPGQMEAAVKKSDGGMLFRIAKIEVYPEWLEAYLAAARTVGAESVAKEPGVVCIFPMQKKENPCSIRIVEIYRSEEAYKAHLASSHFRAYKDGTPHMIKSLELVPMRPLDEDGMERIFIKQKGKQW